MAPDEPRKGLWGRVKDALGAPEEEEDLASRPQVTSTFTASRLPSGDGGPMQARLFPTSGKSSSGKWELYEDSWDELSTAQNPDLGPTDMWAPDQDPEPEPEPISDAAPGEDWPPAEPDDTWLAPIPPAPWETAPTPDTPAPTADRMVDQVTDDLSEALEALVGDPGDDDVLAHLDNDDVAALARAVGYADPDPDAFVAPPEPRPVPAAAEHLDDPPLAPPPAPVASQAVPPLSETPATPPAPVVTARAEPAPPAAAPVPTWQPTPDLDAVRPEAQGDMFSSAPHAVRDRLMSATPGTSSIAPRTTTPTSLAPGADADDPEGGSPPGEIQHDVGAERQIAVHEQRLEAAIARARHRPPPAAKVYDERLDEPAPPQAMNPSEALALAQRGRSAIGPRDDVAPAS